MTDGCLVLFPWNHQAVVGQPRGKTPSQLWRRQEAAFLTSEAPSGLGAAHTRSKALMG